jgi:pimeloyl-ACP methyl ester carboxylesterase
MQVRTRELEFTVHIGGPSDGEPVLLLHGFPQHSGQWHKVAGPLHEAGLRTIAIDQRGYSPGARPTDPAAYVVPECVADAVSIMDELGIPSFHVVGHDWGAVIAWGLAGGHPDRVKSLTAISVAHPLAMGAALRDDPDQQQRSRYMGLFAQLDKAEALLLADDAATLRSLFSGSGMSDAEADVYVQPMREPGALRGALSWYTALTQHGFGASAGPVAVPTTYVWGEEDLALGKTAALATEQFVTASYRFVSLPGISHWVPDQAPEVVAAEIIARVTSAR